MKEKITNLDILRLFAAISVFIYHSHWDLGCNYGNLNYFFSQSAFFMTLFFVLSGFVLYYSCSDKEFNDINEIKCFLVKRIKTIFPLYFFINIFYLLLYLNTEMETDILLDLITFPFQFTLLQCMGYYPYFLNTGLWFFSCIFICYLIFPFLTTIVKQLQTQHLIYLLLFIILLCCSIPFIGMKYGVNVYSNGFVRIWDFGVGMIYAKLYLLYKNKITNKKLISLTTLFVCISTFIIISYLKMYVEHVNIYQEYLKGISIIFSGLLIFLFALNKSKVLDTLGKSKLVQLGSAYSLEIWIATPLATTICLPIFNILSDNCKPILKILIAFFTDFVIAIILKQYSILSQKLISKITLKRYFILILCLFATIFIIKGYAQYNKPFSLDFKNSTIDTSGMVGIYHDEGEHAWITDNFEFKVSNKDYQKVVFTSNHVGIDTFALNIYINETYITKLEVIPGISKYETEIPSELQDSDHFSIQMISDYSFIPADTFAQSSDTRELTLALQYLALE